MKRGEISRGAILSLEPRGSSRYMSPELLQIHATLSSPPVAEQNVTSRLWSTRKRRESTRRSLFSCAHLGTGFSSLCKVPSNTPAPLNLILCSYSFPTQSCHSREMLPIASTSQTPYSQQPAPSYILRGHTAQISVLQFSSNGRWLYSGSVSRSLRSLEVAADPQTRCKGTLMVGSPYGISTPFDLGCSGGRIRLGCSRFRNGSRDCSRSFFSPPLLNSELTLCCTRHARDNLIHYTPLPPSPRSLNRAAASAVPSPKDPTPLPSEWSMDINAMAYCKMSLLRLGKDEQGKEQAVVAVPALTRDELVSIGVVGRQEEER